MTVQKKYLIIAVLAAAAIVNAAYLSYKSYTYHFGGATEISTACDAFGYGSCSDVLRHPLSLVFGIPFPWVALVVYPILCVIALYGYRRASLAPAKTLTILSFLGMCFNGFIIYRELVYIHSYCLLCLLCTVIIITIFGISLSIVKGQPDETVPPMPA